MQSLFFRLILHVTLDSSSWSASVLQDLGIDDLATPDAAPPGIMFVPQVEFFGNHQTTTSTALHTWSPPFKETESGLSAGYTWSIATQDYQQS